MSIMKDESIIWRYSRKLSKLWNGWEIRGLILLSLAIQVILIFFGSQRKHRNKFWIKMIVWSSYMAADWVATVALGNLAKVQIEDYGGDTRSVKKYILQAFWAPFILLHLGGPDTITAYSLEDNELWLRHFLALFVEAAVSGYVIVRSWTGTYLSYFAIPVLVIGFIKYGERTYVLWSASTKKFKDDMLASLRPEKEKKKSRWLRFKNLFAHLLRKKNSLEEPHTQQDQKPQHCLIEAHSLFEKFRYLFANLILEKKDRIYCYNIIVRQKSAEEAFNLVAIELGFLYDVLYTKANLLYCAKMGIFLRCTIFLASITGLVVFLFYMDPHVYEDATDVTVTYLLFVGAVILEFIAFYNFLLSDWTMLWVVKHLKLQIPPCIVNRKRWSGSMAQYNLLDCCLKENEGILRFSVKRLKDFFKSILRSCVKSLPDFLGKPLEEFLNLERRKVTAAVRHAIYEKLKKKGEEISGKYDIKARKEALGRRGDGALQKKIPHQEKDDRKREGDGMLPEEDGKRQGDHRGILHKKDEKHEGDGIRLKKDEEHEGDGKHKEEEDLEEVKFNWCTVDIEFDHSLIVWHIATDILYHAELDCEPDRVLQHVITKYLSDYMLYLLVVCPSMLPQGIGEIRYRDTCAQVTRFYKRLPEGEKPKPEEKSEFCRLLYDKIGRRPANQSVLSDGCKLAQQLKEIEFEDRWKIISEVWIEMLAYVGSHCGWREHAQQLWKGGELLTHVCVLMAHLGLSEQYVEPSGQQNAQ